MIPLNDVKREWLGRFVSIYGTAVPPAVLLLLPFVPHQVIGLMVMMHVLLLVPTFFQNGSVYGPVIRRFQPRGREVFLTLDDGPDPEATPRVLELLDQYGAKACFFVIGKKAAAHPELIREIVRRGHEVANHTDTHRTGRFWAELWWGVGREIDGCSAAISKGDGPAPRWFRSPVGMTNPYVHAVVRRRSMQVLGWSVRAKDAMNRVDHDEVVGRVLREAQPGSIILMHPEWRSADGSLRGIPILERILSGLRSDGYECVLPASGGQRAPAADVKTAKAA